MIQLLFITLLFWVIKPFWPYKLVSDTTLCYDSLIDYYTKLPFKESFVYAIYSIAKQLFFIVLGIGGISALIFFHELGHYLFCKLFSIKTPSFSIGFGPRLFTKRMWDTDFIISAIPLGGYVEIAGLAEVGQGSQEEAQATGFTSFAEKPYYQKALVLLGGIIFNILFAYAAFTAIYLAGVPGHGLLYIESAIPKIDQIKENTPAAQADFKSQDIIKAINGVDINNSIENVADLIKKSENNTAIFTVEREGTINTVTVPLPEDMASCPGHLGIIFTLEDKEPKNIIDSIRQGIIATHRWIKRVSLSYLQLFKKCETKDMAGPIKIISMITQSASQGFLIFLALLAIISINLAIFNLIPIPILDGGQLLIQTIEALSGRTMPLKIREYIFIGTWLIFLLLVIYLSFYDIKSLIDPYISTIKSWFSR